MNANIVEDVDDQNFMVIDFRNGHVPNLVGLKNGNNSCFMNSVMVCLFNIEKFQLCFNNQILFRIISRMPPNLISILENTIKMQRAVYMNSNDCSNIKDSFYKSIINKRHFEINRQADAHEFFVFFIDWLANEVQLIVDKVNQNLLNRERSILSDETAAFYQATLRTANECLNFLNSDFKITFKQTIVCHTGHTSMIVQQAQICLDIDNMDNLNDALNNFFDDVHMPNCICSTNKQQCNAFFCNQCNRHVSARKKIQILLAPVNVLAISIRLFQNTVILG